MFFQLLALFSFFWLPEYSKLTVVVLFSKCLWRFSLLILCMALVAAVWGGVTFRKKRSSHCGTSSLKIIKQNLLLWKGTYCSSLRLPASPTQCSSGCSVFPEIISGPGEFENAHHGKSWPGNRVSDIKVTNAHIIRIKLLAWPANMSVPLVCQAGFSHCYPQAKGHEEHDADTQLTPQIPTFKLGSPRRRLQTHLNGLLSDQVKSGRGTASWPFWVGTTPCKCWATACRSVAAVWWAWGLMGAGELSLGLGGLSRGLLCPTVSCMT